MCIKIVRGKMVFDYKRFAWFVGVSISVITLAGLVKVKCGNGIVYAQEKFVRAEAVDVFDSLHKPFEARLCSLKDSISETKNDVAILIEMVKISNSDKPNLYRDAKNAVENSGKFPE